MQIGIIKTLFFFGAIAAIVFSQRDDIQLSWALFLCFVSAVCVVGLFTWEKRDDRWEKEQ